MIAAIQLLNQQRQILENNISVFSRRMQDANNWHLQNFKEKEAAISQLKQVEDALRTLTDQRQDSNN